MKRNMKIHNHLYPAFHIRKWAASGGQIYDKTKGESREINPQEDYSLKYYIQSPNKNKNYSINPIFISSIAKCLLISKSQTLI